MAYLDESDVSGHVYESPGAGTEVGVFTEEGQLLDYELQRGYRVRDTQGKHARTVRLGDLGGKFFVRNVPDLIINQDNRVFSLQQYMCSLPNAEDIIRDESRGSIFLLFVSISLSNSDNKPS